MNISTSLTPSEKCAAVFIEREQPSMQPFPVATTSEGGALRQVESVDEVKEICFQTMDDLVRKLLNAQ